MNTQFKIDSASIIKVLMNKHLLIPVYQRSYKWSGEHVNALIDDVIARANDGSAHFFGVVALSKHTKSIDGIDKTISKVIDGQQRLTTSLLLYIWLARNTKEEFLDEETKKILSNEKAIMFDHEMKESTLKDNIKNLINENYSAMKGQFKINWELISNRLRGYSPDFIKKLFKTFKEKFVIATIDYEIDKEEEMLVFENLNSKGSPLAPFDLIRNYIFSMCKNDPQENLRLFNKHIMNLTQTVYKDVAAPSKIESKYERFMEQYIIFRKLGQLDKYANYGVYKNFKTVFHNHKNLSEDNYDKFLYEMRKYAILYFDMEVKKGIGENIWLKTLSQKDNHYPFVFLLFETYGTFDQISEKWQISSNINNYIKVVAQHIIKVMVVQGTGQSFTNMYIKLMQLVKENNATPSQIREMLNKGDIRSTSETPNNDEFKAALLSAPKQKWIPGALINILEYIAHNNSKLNEKISFNSKTIEHIMPQKPKEKDWPFVIGHMDEHKQTVNQIGNLVNLDQGPNSKIGNNSFIKKLEIYKESSSPLITGQHLNVDPLIEDTIFTFETIKKRTASLTKELIKEFDSLDK